jgi:hypothetical protein
MAASSSALLHELHIRLDPHLVGHQDAAGLDHLVPLEAPLPAVDLAARREAAG